LPRRCHGASRSEYANLAVPSALISRLCAIADLSFLFSRFRLLYQNLWVLSSLSEKTRLDNFIRKRGGMQQQLLDMAKVHTPRSLRRFHPATYDSRCPRKPPEAPYARSPILDAESCGARAVGVLRGLVKLVAGWNCSLGWCVCEFSDMTHQGYCPRRQPPMKDLTI
jgi:hypothetical protein